MLRALVTKGAWPSRCFRQDIVSVAAASTHGSMAAFSTNIDASKESVFVTNISFEVMKRKNWENLKTHFSNYGVSNIFYVKDKQTKQFLGQAIIALHKDKIDQAVADLDGKEFMGRELRVRKNLPRPDSKAADPAAAPSATQSGEQATQSAAAPSATQSGEQATQSPAAPSATQSGGQATQSAAAPSATQSGGQAT